MRKWGKVARAAVAASLGAVLVAGSAVPAFAEVGAADTPVPGESANVGYTSQVRGESNGDTKLYVIGRQDDLTTSEGSVTENVRVSIPVAIHYVADERGNLVGPADNVVKFVNHTKLGSVHVSKIAVQNSGDARIVADSDALANDEMSFFVRPVAGVSDDAGASFTPAAAQGEPAGGTIDQLGTYADKAHGEGIDPTHRDEWDIAQKNGALALNGLTGRIGGFGKLDPSTDYQAGTIHWTVRAGTRAQADEKDASVTIHYNSNDGSNAGCVPVADQKVRVLQTNALPNKVADAEGLATPVHAGAADVVAPHAVTHADGSETTYRFKGWNTRADGTGTWVATVSDMGSAAELAGTVQELYAVFEEA